MALRFCRLERARAYLLTLSNVERLLWCDGPLAAGRMYNCPYRTSE
jgi:hypothetical protein